MGKRGQQLSKIVKLVISGLIMIYLFKLVNYKLLVKSFKTINPLYLYLCLLLIPLGILIRAYSFHLIINKDGHKLGLKSAYALTLIGLALNIFLPFNSGDLLKTYYGYQRYSIKEELISAFLIDKISSAVAIFLIGTIAAYILKLNLLMLLSGILGCLCVVVFLFPRIIPWQLLNKIVSYILRQSLDVERLQQATDVSSLRKLYLVAVSIVGWFLTFLVFYFVALSFSVQLPFYYLVAISPVITLASLFPFTASGLGSTEATVVYFFGLIKIPLTQAVLVVFALRIINTLPGLGGLIFIWSGKRNIKQAEKLS